MVTVAVLSTAEVIRAFRFLNVLFGIWLLIAPWALAGATPVARWSDMAAGVAIAILAMPRGSVQEKYAGWNTYVV